MSVARMLGVDDAESPMMREARRRWTSWADHEPDLRQVGHLLDLPGWTRKADQRSKDEVLRTLAKLGSPSGGDDEAAVTALVWAMVPGAIRLSLRLSDLSPDVDGLVAAHLWIAARTFDWQRRGSVAGSIVRETRRAVLAELGVGEAGRRQDRAWSQTTCLSPASPAWSVLDREVTAGEDSDASDELDQVLADARTCGGVSEVDLRLLLDLAVAADSAVTPIRHGRGGLMAPAASEVVAGQLGVTSRTVRRRARRSLDALRDLAMRDEWSSPQVSRHGSCLALGA